MNRGGGSNDFMRRPGNVITQVTAVRPLCGQTDDILWLQTSSRRWKGRFGLRLFTRSRKPAGLTSIIGRAGWMGLVSRSTQSLW